MDAERAVPSPTVFNACGGEGGPVDEGWRKGKR